MNLFLIVHFSGLYEDFGLSARKRREIPLDRTSAESKLEMSVLQQIAHFFLPLPPTLTSSYFRLSYHPSA